MDTGQDPTGLHQDAREPVILEPELGTIADILAWYDQDPSGGIAALKRLVYQITECGASVELVEGGLDIWSIIEGSDASTIHHHLLFPFNLALFKTTLDRIEDQAAELWHEANCHQSDCKRATCEGCALDCPHVEHSITEAPGRSRFVDGEAIRPDREVQVALTQEDWDEANGEMYAITFRIPNVGRFDLLGDLMHLKGILDDAHTLIVDEHARKEREEAEADDTTPDDHPGFDPQFFTF